MLQQPPPGTWLATTIEEAHVPPTAITAVSLAPPVHSPGQLCFYLLALQSAVRT